eukprot:TRINITY_DN12296_c0_g1_i1.p1 TRINITY_DN12296_c0_g1~~TRINITY_DN12296_c0_g1_i1.p1  ORF type:complete len:385 (-),score=99.27 TRINITY_DN12296_c0_g1_i1:299-1453(-)
MSSGDGLRRRRAEAPAASAGESTTKRALESLRHFDVYTKVDEDCLQRSTGGGVVTVITSCIVTFLFWSELCAFCSHEVVDSITVDTRINQKLSIGLNVTFPHLRCDEVSVDTVDSSGDNQVNVHGQLHKLILDEFSYPSPQKALPPGTCLPCMEGEDEEHKCCNTCEELKEAIALKQLPSAKTLAKAAQCEHNRGCRIEGKVHVNKVSGNVHVALGKSAIRDGKHVHEFNMEDISAGFNTSHRIDQISFGDVVPGQVSVLEGTMKIVKHGDFMFHYYIKLVPTVYIDQYGKHTYTNQYSVTDSAKNVRVKTGELSGLPGVFMVYDFSPFLMRKTEKVKPWSYIFTSICAIIGGVFTIGSLVEMLVNALSAGGAVVGCAPSLGKV